MLFKNAIFFQFPIGLIKEQSIFDGIHECRLKPVGALELSSRGFAQVVEADNDALAMPIQEGHTMLLCLAGEDKILPASAVNGELAKILANIEKKEGRKPGGRTRKRLKEDLIHAMLPKALVKPSRTHAILDLDRGLLVVDTSSRKVAEEFASHLRHALGSFPALPLNSELSPRSVLTGWIAGEPLREDISLGEEAILKDTLEGGAVARLSNQDLEGEEVTHHLEAGKQCTRLGLVISEAISCTIDEDLTVRKIKFLDAAMEKIENTEREDLYAEIRTRAWLSHAALVGVHNVMTESLKLSPAAQ